MNKNIIKLFAATAASVLAFSCTPDFMTPDKSQLPQASDLTPVITVDQETNYVTFSIQEKGVVPMWIFGEDKVDGKANKKYAYTGNGISLRIREEGTHTVELKAYNANGVSLGSKMVEYSLTQTFRDPFDPSPYVKKLANTWVWNSSAAGHFGCGEPGTDGLNWWSAGADEKKDWSLYDDKMTFTADGTYTYDPGDGQVYVNKDSGYKNEYNTNDGNDYLAPIDGYTHPFTVENNWNDAGIEEIFLVLQDGDNLSYIPNPEALTNPRYQILSLTSKQADFVIDNGGISWHYQFVPFVKGLTKEEMLAGTDAKGKVWVMDSEAAGHLGCGPDGSNPAGWWSAGANEKAAFGMYDDELTFYPDGKYEFNPGPDGKIYVNKDVTALLGSAAAEDVDIPFETQSATYKFDGETIKFSPEGTVIGYVPNNAFLEDPTFYVTEISQTKLVGYTVTDGIAWQFIFRARDVKAPSQTIAGQEVAGGKVDLSLTNGQTVEVAGIEMTSIDADYFEGEGNTLTFIAPSGDYRIYVQDGFLKVIPLTDGEASVFPNSIWIIGEGAGKPQGAAPGWNTGEAADIPFVKNGSTYTVTLYAAGNTNIKLFEQPNWGDDNTGERVWLKNRYASFEGNGFFEMPDADGNIHAASGLAEGWYVFTAVDTDGAGALALTIDKKKETYYDVTGDTNLWKGAKINPELWYADGGWGQIGNPEYEIGEGNSYTATMPAGIGGTEWQGQNKLHSGIATSSEKIYDFCVTLTADEDCVVTIKLTGNPEGEGDPHAFFYDGNVVLEAGVPFTYKKAKISQPQSNDDFTVIFDYGRVPAGKTVAATEICFQEHLEK